jgi:hypothetical protein
MGRERKVVVVLGAPGTGKTGGVVIPLVRQYVKRHGAESVRGLDVSGDLAMALPDMATQWEWPGSSKVDEWFRTLTAEGQGPAGGGWGPGLLVLPDADRYLSPHTMGSMRDLWLANRHLGLDVILDAHRPQEFPPGLFLAASEIWLFSLEEVNANEKLSHVKGIGRIIRMRLAHMRETSEKKRAQLAKQIAEEEILPLPTEKGQALRINPKTGDVGAFRLFHPAS